MAKDTWFSRDLPVLEMTMEMLEEEGRVDSRELAKRLNLDLESVAKALKVLDGEYLEVGWMHQDAGLAMVMSSTATARRLVGQWPSAESLADRAEAVLDERIENSENDEERSRWVKLRDAATGAGRDLMVDVMGAVISKQLTGG